MKIFLSWSGSKSRSVAEALAEFTPLILQTARPLVADAAISAGDRWTTSIMSALGEAQAAIICLTKDNITNPWLAFEAGALSGKLQSSRFFPLLIDFSVRELSGPLAQFQAVRPERVDLLNMYLALNAASEFGAPREVIETLFTNTWPRLDQRLHAILERKSDTPEVSPQSALPRLKELETKLAELATKLDELVQKYSKKA